MACNYKQMLEDSILTYRKKLLQRRITRTIRSKSGLMNFSF
ncbi:hypothetical protein TSAR_002990 [Trichomalopsis sarcophagae]|uniref:Uncharacterized protein n=1 Tax=Trichomalopsis sarcophagae TaxID=543379 RepID=A0A232ENA4_9HYME|nr:hypothetical protein TSAR_002990 [Trichomalopsis sarcophagae]